MPPCQIGLIDDTSILVLFRKIIDNLVQAVYPYNTMRMFEFLLLITSQPPIKPTPPPPPCQIGLSDDTSILVLFRKRSDNLVQAVYPYNTMRMFKFLLLITSQPPIK